MLNKFTIGLLLVLFASHGGEICTAILSFCYIVYLTINFQTDKVRKIPQ